MVTDLGPWQRWNQGAVGPRDDRSSPDDVSSQAMENPCGDIYSTQFDQYQQPYDSGSAFVPPTNPSQNFGGGSDEECDPPAGSDPWWGYRFSNHFHHRDHLGNVRAVTNAAGWKENLHDFYPFGTEIDGDDKMGTRKRFTGHERDVNTGLDYMLARYHSAGLGRFLSVDPLQASAKSHGPQTWNRYAYTVSNPIRFTDPDGRQSTDEMRFFQGIKDVCDAAKQEIRDMREYLPERQTVEDFGHAMSDIGAVTQVLGIGLGLGGAATLRPEVASAGGTIAGIGSGSSVAGDLIALAADPDDETNQARVALDVGGGLVGVAAVKTVQGVKVIHAGLKLTGTKQLFKEGVDFLSTYFATVESESGDEVNDDSGGNQNWGQSSAEEETTGQRNPEKN